jgi:hypothetical protein
MLIKEEKPISFESVETMVISEEPFTPATQVRINEVDLLAYDALLSVGEAAPC